MRTAGGPGLLGGLDSQGNYNNELYAMGATLSRNNMKKAIAANPGLRDLMKKAMPKEMGTGCEVPLDKWSLDHPLIKQVGRELIKAGVTTALGFNYYDLRGPAYFIFPLLTPFIQMIGSQGKVNAGVGTVAHWKATRNPNSTNVYSGLLEGQRNALASPDEIDAISKGGLPDQPELPEPMSSGWLRRQLAGVFGNRRMG